VLRERLSEADGEFPQHDWRLTGRPHRYSYLAARTADSLAPNAIVKTDQHTAEEHAHELPAGHVVGEPIFVPRATDAGEDDGWLLAVAYDSVAHGSRLLVLDARDPEREPLYVGHLRHHVPQGFHGTFTRRVADPDRG
jgi:all-trans-8'-apo-beta-carotenal 15,15'-oxygenase